MRVTIGCLLFFLSGLSAQAGQASYNQSYAMSFVYAALVKCSLAATDTFDKINDMVQDIRGVEDGLDAFKALEKAKGLEAACEEVKSKYGGPGAKEKLVEIDEG